MKSDPKGRFLMGSDLLPEITCIPLDGMRAITCFFLFKNLCYNREQNRVAAKSIRLIPSGRLISVLYCQNIFQYVIITGFYSGYCFGKSGSIFIPCLRQGMHFSFLLFCRITAMCFARVSAGNGSCSLECSLAIFRLTQPYRSLISNFF